MYYVLRKIFINLVIEVSDTVTCPKHVRHISTVSTVSVSFLIFLIKYKVLKKYPFSKIDSCETVIHITISWNERQVKRNTSVFAFYAYS